MPLRLPDLTELNCGFFTACGEVKTDKPEVLDWLRNHKPMVARTKIKKTHQVVVQVGGVAGGSEVHLHIDVSAPGVFPKGQIPKQTQTIAEIGRELQTVIGCEVDLNLEGWFEVKTADLPNVIRVTLVESSMDQVTVKMTGGQLSVEGIPLYRIDWRVVKNKEIALLGLFARGRVSFSDSYLEDSWQIIKTAYGTVIKRGAKRGERKE